jgi:hypothetical protein
MPSDGRLAAGTNLLWQVRKDIVLAVVQQLPEGSYLSEIFEQRDIHYTRSAVRVRVVEYTIAGHEDVYRLITTILDPTRGPAQQLAALYAQRRGSESTLDEFKTHLGGASGVALSTPRRCRAGALRFPARAPRDPDP